MSNTNVKVVDGEVKKKRTSVKIIYKNNSHTKKNNSQSKLMFWKVPNKMGNT